MDPGKAPPLEFVPDVRSDRQSKVTVFVSTYFNAEVLVRLKVPAAVAPAFIHFSRVLHYLGQRRYIYMIYIYIYIYIYDIYMIYDTDIILYIPMQGELFVEQFFSLLLYRVQYHIMRYDT